MRLDPRCVGAQRRLAAQGLHAEVVQIKQVYYNAGQLRVERPGGRHRTFTIDNPALLDHLNAVLSKPGALPSPAVLYATTRAELLTHRFFVWLPGEGEHRAEGSKAVRGQRQGRMPMRSRVGRSQQPKRRPITQVRLPGL